MFRKSIPRLYPKTLVGVAEDPHAVLEDWVQDSKISHVSFLRVRY